MNSTFKKKDFEKQNFEQLKVKELPPVDTYEYKVTFKMETNEVSITNIVRTLGREGFILRYIEVMPERENEGISGNTVKLKFTEIENSLTGEGSSSTIEIDGKEIIIDNKLTDIYRRKGEVPVSGKIIKRGPANSIKLTLGVEFE